MLIISWNTNDLMMIEARGIADHPGMLQQPKTLQVFLIFFQPSLALMKEMDSLWNGVTRNTQKYQQKVG